MASAALAGSTGLVGSHILTQLIAHPSITAVNAFTRRELPASTASPKLYPLSSTDPTLWPSLFPRTPAPKIFISALGTTRGAAGSVENQRKIDLDLNYDLAKAAKDAGVETYVLISAASANAASKFAYTQMKGELEEKVKALGFKHTVIVRPGLIMGTRGESRPAEAIVRHVAWGLKRLSPALTDSWAQDAETIARAAVEAGVRCGEGKREGEGVWDVGQVEINKLGAQK